LIEVEIKGYADRSLKKLLDERYKVADVRLQEDIYFSHPCRDMRQTDEALRIRVERRKKEEVASLTYKGPRVDEKSKTREEIEVGITDPRGLKMILERLGFRVIAHIRKRRTIYSTEGFKLSFDEVDGLGCFVEVEEKVKSLKGYQERRDKLLNFMKDLGISRLERRSYLELMLDKLTKG